MPNHLDCPNHGPLSPSHTAFDRDAGPESTLLFSICVFLSLKFYAPLQLGPKKIQESSLEEKIY